ncbi:vWA domain-containing protein [Poseidonibacter lekithochrous]|uniref:vWA domain-containing protein n=1 Tax=Poseidonibacter lekithochrous TaxID=1904463 RepID=UPI0008FC4BAD|nr:VWA domain-containing protein [Poseidonibacter lekithochrous]QKJ23973.1 von Willebrand factor type A (vWA) domain-containing protein [Poseidonibacter lekithochrous]
MSFIYTNVLFLMLIPALLLMFLLISKRNNFEQYFSKEALDKLSVSNQYFSKKARNITLFISLIFMIIALARPVTNEKEQRVKQELNTLLVAIDVSKSMLATDLYPNRLDFATKKLLSIIENSKDTAIAVILFAKSSFILSPLTEDFHSLKILVENLDTGANFDNGTNIYSTLEVTNKLLKNSANKNLLLLTDGGDKKDFEKEIDFAKENKINVYTIALASKEGSAIKLQDGNFLTNKNGDIVTLSVNENIKKLALSTNGGYINYSINNSDINAILNDILKTSKKENIQSKKYKTYTELFYYPLAIGIFLLLLAFSSLPKIRFSRNKSNSLFLVLFVSLFLTNDTYASIFDFQTIEQANADYKAKEYQNATKEYSKLSSSKEQQYNLANSLYKENKYKEAIEKYKNIKSEDRNLNFNKLHNIGNAYAKSNDLQNAKKSYEEALKIKNDKQTQENLDTVNKALEKKEKKKKDQKGQKKNKEKKQEKKKKEDKKQEKSNDSKENKKNKKENKKKDAEKKEHKEKKKSDQKINKKEMSDKEENRWLKQLEKKKANSLLKKIESSQEDDSINPW